MQFKNVFSSAMVIFAIFVSSMGFAQVSLTEGGVSGEWYNPTRDGEGIFVEIIDSAEGQRITVAWFTYDLDGFQMWLVGSAPLEGFTSVAIPVIVTNGPKFGQNYDMADLNSQTWGTLTLTFPTCDSALLSYASTVAGYDSGAIDMIRLTKLTQVRCTDVPVPPPETGITPGRWTGPGVCFNVSEDGRTLTSEDSSCDLRRSVDLRLSGKDELGVFCDIELKTTSSIAIIEGVFAFSQGGQAIIGTFTSSDSAVGVTQENRVRTCTAEWVADPE